MNPQKVKDHTSDAVGAPKKRIDEGNQTLFGADMLDHTKRSEV
jgi:hypothetical protein